MKIAITSQNFRTVTGHGGKARRFLVYAISPDTTVTEMERLDLPIDMAMHGFDDCQQHPLDEVDYLITGGAGAGFVQRMARRGVRVVTTAETDPEIAVHAFLAGCLKPPAPHDHDPGHAEEHGESHSCGCSH
jgi:predicted Fe-Mo cluster-binding NifX family protein